jgi:inorganic triphosphatase YgiF
VELEIKFKLATGSITALDSHPALQSTAGAVRTRHEVTTYFDTRSEHLNKLGASLRVRRSGKRHVQTLKLRAPQGPFGRNEWEWPIRRETPELELLAETPVAPMLGPSPVLEPVFFTDVQRTVRTVRRDETTIEVALDVGRIHSGSAEEEILELELELKDGDAVVMYRLAAALHSSVPMSVSAESKADRGWRLRVGRSREAVKHANIDLPDDVTAAEAFRRIIEVTLAHLVANQPAAAGGDIEGVHQSRVAIRRLRAALTLFRPLLEPHAEARFTEALRALGRVFGEARDWDVFCGEMLVSAQEHGVSSSWVDLLRQPAEALRMAAHAHVLAEMQAPGFTATVLGLAEWGAPAGEAMDRPIRELMPNLLERLEQKVLRRGRHIARRTAGELHALRKATKKLRYNIEYLAPLLRHKHAKAYLHRSKRLLKQLGALNDAVVAVALAEQLGGKRQPELAPAVAALADWAAARQSAACHHLPKDWQALQTVPMPR